MVRVSREKILDAFVDAFLDVIGVEKEEFEEDIGIPCTPDAIIAEAAEGYSENLPYWIADAITEVVDEIFAEQIGDPHFRFAWYTDILFDDLKFTNEYLFVAVDPRTKKCVTASKDIAKDYRIGLIFAITSEDDLVYAIQSLVEHISENLSDD